MLMAGIGIGALAGAAADKPVKLENLLRTELALAPDLEVIVSVVEIAADMKLPEHHHPGEEFVYLLEGSATLWQQGKSDTPMQAGDLYKIPLDQVHTAITGTQAAKALVFRVHRKGMPERIAN
jgi:quercetin dioxygenase-like cupin family protein